MGFLWRRRSTVVKIIILLTAIWFTIVFLLYTEDRRSPDHPRNLQSHNKNNIDVDLGGGDSNSIKDFDQPFNNAIFNEPEIKKSLNMNGNQKSDAPAAAINGNNIDNDEGIIYLYIKINYFFLWL